MFKWRHHRGYQQHQLETTTYVATKHEYPRFGFRHWKRFLERVCERKIFNEILSLLTEKFLDRKFSTIVESLIEPHARDCKSLKNWLNRCLFSGLGHFKFTYWSGYNRTIQNYWDLTNGQFTARIFLEILAELACNVCVCKFRTLFPDLIAR